LAPISRSWWTQLKNIFPTPRQSTKKHNREAFHSTLRSLSVKELAVSKTSAIRRTFSPNTNLGSLVSGGGCRRWGGGDQVEQPLQCQTLCPKANPPLVSMAGAYVDSTSLILGANVELARWKGDGPIVLLFRYPVRFPATHPLLA
jgi:hypothetical protein